MPRAVAAAAPAGNAVGECILERCTGQHDAGTIVVGEDERSLEGPGRGNDAPGADLPQPLAQHAGREVPPPFRAHGLERTYEVVIVDAEGECARDHPDARALHGCDERLHLGIRGHGTTQARAAFEQQRPRTGARGRNSRGETGNAAADHEHVRFGGELLVVIGIGLARGGAETRHPPDRRLEPPPARPLEGLVVEARWQEWRECSGERADVEADARPAIHARGAESLSQRKERRAHVRGAASARSHIDDRVRLLHATAEGAARTVELEAAPDESHAVCEQCGGERIAAEATEGAPIEGEAEGPRPVDPRASGCLEAMTHGASFGAGGGSSMRYTARTS